MTNKQTTNPTNKQTTNFKGALNSKKKENMPLQPFEILQATETQTFQNQTQFQLPCNQYTCSSKDSVWLPMCWGNKKRSHTQYSQHEECICQYTHTQWPPECSAEGCHNKNTRLVWAEEKTNYATTQFIQTVLLICFFISAKRYFSNFCVLDSPTSSMCCTALALSTSSQYIDVQSRSVQLKKHRQVVLFNLALRLLIQW